MNTNKIVLFKSSDGEVCAKSAHTTRISENDMFIDETSKYAKNAYLVINNQ